MVRRGAKAPSSSSSFRPPLSAAVALLCLLLAAAGAAGAAGAATPVRFTRGWHFLGPFTVGKNARIAANAVVLREVPAGVTVVGIPGRIAKGKADNDQAFEAYGTTADVKDPVDRRIEALVTDVERLSNRIETLEAELAETRNDGQRQAANR